MYGLWLRGLYAWRGEGTTRIKPSSRRIASVVDRDTWRGLCNFVAIYLCWATVLIQIALCSLLISRGDAHVATLLGMTLMRPQHRNGLKGLSGRVKEFSEFSDNTDIAHYLLLTANL